MDMVPSLPEMILHALFVQNGHMARACARLLQATSTHALQAHRTSSHAPNGMHAIATVSQAVPLVAKKAPPVASIWWFPTIIP